MSRKEFRIALVVGFVSFAGLIPGRNNAPADPLPPLPATTVPEGLGVNVRFPFIGIRPGEIDMLAAAGVRWVRADLEWASTEVARGRYDFTRYDRLMAALAPHRIRTLFILGQGHDLYDGGQSPHSEEAR